MKEEVFVKEIREKNEGIGIICSFAALVLGGVSILLTISLLMDDSILVFLTNIYAGVFAIVFLREYFSNRKIVYVRKRK